MTYKVEFTLLLSKINHDPPCRFKGIFEHFHSQKDFQLLSKL